MGKTKKVRKPYHTSDKKRVFNKKDKLFGQVKLVFLIGSVVVIGVLVISKINS